MSEVKIDVTLKIKTDKIDVELTKEEAKKLRDALDTALKTDAVESFPCLLEYLKKPKPEVYPWDRNPLDPYGPRKFGEPYWEWQFPIIGYATPEVETIC